MPSISSLTGSLYDVLARYSRNNAVIKGRSEVLRNKTVVTRMQVLEHLNVLADALAALQECVAVPGIVAFAQQQLNQPTRDVVADYQTTRVQIIATQNWITTNFPHDANGNAAVYSFDANQRYQDVNLAAGQLTAFKANLASLSATID